MSDLDERAVDFEEKHGWSPDYGYDVLYEHHGWDGKCFYDDTEPIKDQDTINWLRSENAYLRGQIKAYEKFLKRNGIIADIEEEE